MSEYWIDEFVESGKSTDREEVLKEIDEVKGTISNERLWLKGSSSKLEEELHTSNIVELQVYLDWLEEQKEKIA